MSLSSTPILCNLVSLMDQTQASEVVLKCRRTQSDAPTVCLQLRDKSYLVQKSRALNTDEDFEDAALHRLISLGQSSWNQTLSEMAAPYQLPRPSEESLAEVESWPLVVQCKKHGRTFLGESTDLWCACGKDHPNIVAEGPTADICIYHTREALAFWLDRQRTAAVA